MKKILLSLLLLVPFMAFASDYQLTKIGRSSMHVAHDIGKVSLYHNGSTFLEKRNGIKTEIGSESLDPALRQVNSSNIGAFLKAGRIQVTSTSDGRLMLRHYVDGKGGGPILATFSYWAVKTLCWGGIMGAGGVVVGSGVGAVVAAAGGGGAALTTGTLAGLSAKAAMGIATGQAMTAAATMGTTVAATSGIAVSTLGVPLISTAASLLGASTGAGIVAGALTVTAEGAAIATIGTAAAAPAMAGTALGVAGGIEALAMAAYIAAMAAPTP